MTKIIRPLLIATALFLPHPALSANSEWQDLGGGKARLIALKNADNGKLSGVVEVRLEPGWKTYWRSPGSSGIAPEFDFSASRHSFIQTIRFPVPEWITLPDASFYGYRDKVLFGFDGIAERDDADLALNLLIGVCEEICIPATAQFEISAAELNRSDPKSEIQINMAAAGFPAPASDGMALQKLVLRDQQISFEGTIKADHARTNLVLTHENGWNSDPIALSADDQGHFSSSIDLSETVSKQLGKNSQSWLYTLVAHDGNGDVIQTIEGVIDAN